MSNKEYFAMGVCTWQHGVRYSLSLPLIYTLGISVVMELAFQLCGGVTRLTIMKKEKMKYTSTTPEFDDCSTNVVDDALVEVNLHFNDGCFPPSATYS
jgi:hypothetical protein